MKTVIFLLLIFTACLVRSDNKGSDAMYVKLTKGLVLNYGEPSLARLRYLKVDVHARVKSADDADAVEYHSPALQDILVSIFCAQDEDSVASAEGKEEIRAQVLSAFQKLIKKEEGETIVQDVLFTSFIVQR